MEFVNMLDENENKTISLQYVASLIDKYKNAIDENKKQKYYNELKEIHESGILDGTFLNTFEPATINMAVSNAPALIKQAKNIGSGAGTIMDLIPKIGEFLDDLFGGGPKDSGGWLISSNITKFNELVRDYAPKGETFIGDPRERSSWKRVPIPVAYMVNAEKLAKVGKSMSGNPSDPLSWGINETITKGALSDIKNLVSKYPDLQDKANAIFETVTETGEGSTKKLAASLAGSTSGNTLSVPTLLIIAAIALFFIFKFK